MAAQPIAVYLHTPFCPSKCGYCDFNSYAMEGEIMGQTTAATIEQIRRSPLAGRPAKTIFFGGGTPTYLPVEQILALLGAVIEAHPPVDGCEITSEANPGTADADKFEAMRSAGFNRLSLGAQSFNSDDLIRLGRVHSESEIGRAVRLAREAGFENLNLDLMFALPGQAVAGWEHNLTRALALKPDHLSLYCLTLEPNTAFYKDHLRGRLVLPEEDVQVDLYDLAVARMEAAGYRQYEISNFAKPGYECLHNLCYWRNEEYVGYGPGAVGLAEGTRTTVIKHPRGFCEAIEAGKSPFCEVEPLTDDAKHLETIMLGLRLVEGFHPGTTPLSEKGLETALSRQWLQRSHDRLALTPEGRHFCSEVALLLAP